MKRRTWLQLSTAFLVGCERSPQSFGTTLEAGPFSMVVPPDWAESAVIEKVLMRPVYSSGEWAAFRKDSAYALKPDYLNRPEHWAIRLPALALKGTEYQVAEAGGDTEAPQVLIHKAEEWEKARSDGLHEEHSRSETIRRLRSELEEGKKEDSAIRSPAFVDASLDFICLKKELIFAGGSGIRMICQWGWEPDLIRRGRLHYLFLGLSSDGTCQIMATFPLDHVGLPSASPEAAHLGWSLSRYEDLERDFPAYRAAATNWISENSGGFSPGLEVLDGMIQSLEVERWA